LSEVALLDRKLDGGAMMTTTQQPTERDRYWLNHEAAIKTSGQTAKAYAADRELSLQGKRPSWVVMAEPAFAGKYR
jgi:hypothetical protein